MDQLKNLFSSRPGVIGLFATLTLLLAIPLTVLLSQENQDNRQYASNGKGKGNDDSKGKGKNKGSETFESGTTFENRTVSNNNNDQENDDKEDRIASRFITGYVFIDANDNGRRDVEEKPYPQAMIKIIESDTLKSDLKADTYGYFNTSVTSESFRKSSFTVLLTVPQGYKATSQNPISLANTATSHFVEFGIAIAPSTLPSVKPSISIKPSCAPRPACLDATPRCLIAEPVGGWCPRPLVTTVPTKPYVSPTRVPTPRVTGTTTSSGTSNTGTRTIQGD